MKQTKLTLREKLAYAGGELGQQLSTTYVNTFLMVFFVNILKIPSLTRRYDLSGGHHLGRHQRPYYGRHL